MLPDMAASTCPQSRLQITFHQAQALEDINTKLIYQRLSFLNLSDQNDEVALAPN
jgi:hypothetical protein